MILSYIRTIVLYLVLIFSVRMMGKRQVGEMEPAEFVVTMLIANLAAIPMQDGAIPLYSGLVPILTVLGVELTLSGMVFRSIRFRRFLCGKPVILIDNGVLDVKSLRRTRVTLDELSRQLREKDILSFTAVQYAILETDGQVSVFPYPKERPASAKDAGVKAKAQFLPITIIEDGFLSKENLQRARKDEVWLASQLKAHNARVEDTLLLTLEAEDRVLWLGKEDAR